MDLKNTKTAHHPEMSLIGNIFMPGFAKLIEEAGLQPNVVMTGYLQDEELEDHFALSDAYVVPSRKEGFGLVFIEAMCYELPVICRKLRWLSRRFIEWPAWPIGKPCQWR